MKIALFAMLLAFALRADEPSLIKADTDFCKAAAERGAEGFVSYFADEASILPAKSPVVNGIANIREVYRKIWATPGFSLKWKPLKSEISRSGDLGYTFGTYERRRTDAEGKPVLETGKYMTIWRKQKDGAWKVIADMGN